MADYAIGDVQGCYEALQALLKKINFKADKDHLYFLGDLVNRGGQSLAVLRWIHAHQANCHNVLGNHDLSLLHQYHLPKRRKKNREFKAIFAAPDAQLLMQWLLSQPLMIELPEAVMSHAGVYPLWNIKTQLKHSEWAMSCLREHPKKFLKKMYGDEPNSWQRDLSKTAKWRFIVNVSTRMRFVDSEGGLNFTEKSATTSDKSLQPWFDLASPENYCKDIYFGHWSTLGLYRKGPINCLDSGCVWGAQLTAVRLQDKVLFQVE